MPQTQEEFYFALPHDRMDLLLYAFANDVPPEQAGAALGLTAQQVERSVPRYRRQAPRGSVSQPGCFACGG